jgi:FG-GAP-like repeat
MKKRLQFCFLLALLASQAFAAQQQPSQFSVKTPKQKAALQAKLNASAQSRAAAMPGRTPFSQVYSALIGDAKRQSSRVRPHTGNPPLSNIGFAAATQIPAGGGASFAALGADFNGDGKQDVGTLVGVNYNTVTSLWTFAISVVLSNGNGTFQAAQLTPNPNGTWDDEILSADLNGDGKQDLVVVHTPSPSTFDVFLGNGDGTFALANPSPIPLSSSNLIAGVLSDVSGDGKIDLVVIDDQSPANLSVLLGNGDGTFQSASAAALTGGNLSNIAFADFNGDGKIDFAATDSNSNSQTVVYLAQSNGTYLAGAPLVTAEHVYGACSTAAGDLNGDGKPEIVTANCGSNLEELIVYLNNGDGTFQSGSYYAPAENSAAGTDADLYPVAVTIADVNGDGKNDIVCSNYTSSDVTILLGNGDGTVRVPNVGYSTGGNAGYPAVVADFNGDGLADIIIPDENYSLVYLQGYGDGSFRAANDYYAPIFDDYGANSTAIASGDFNGDGYPDFVVGNSGYNQYGVSTIGITVFLSRSDGTLAPGVNYGSGGNFVGVAVADFDGDKILDIAAVDDTNNLVQIFHGKGDGTFTMTSSYSTGGSDSWFVVTGDFNGDGHPDLAVANWNSENLTVLLNDGTGAFLPSVIYPVSANVDSIGAADLNGDGFLDLIAIDSYPGAVSVLLGNPDGTFQTANTSSWGYNYLGNLAVGDLDGDGIPDLAVTVDDGTSVGSTGLAVAKGNGDGSFQPPVFYSTTMQNLVFNQPYPGDVKMFDLDGDGRLDLLYTNENYGTVGILFNTGANPFAAGMFYDPVEYPGGNYANFMALADVNQDGAMDVVVSGDEFAGATVLLNNSGAALQPNFTLAAASNTATVDAGASAAYSLTVAGYNGYSGTVTLACSGLPALAACSFSPASVVANGHLALPSTLTITTTAATASFAPPSRPASNPGAPTFLAAFGGLGLFGIVIAGSGKQRNRRKVKLAVLLGISMLVMTFTLVGCGGGGSGSNLNPGPGSPGTPGGTYAVTVTATGAAPAITHSLNLTLIVQ